MATRYSIVQYVPDALTGERINLGIVAIGQDRMATQFISSWDRVECFAGGRQIGFLREFVAAFEEADPDQLGISALAPVESLTVESLERIASRWKNSIQFTPLAASLKSPNELVETLAPRYLRMNPPRQRPQPARSRSTARRIAVSAVRLAAELAAVKPVVRRMEELPGRLEGHRFDAVAANGRPILAMQGISFEVNEDEDMRRMVDALAFSLVDVREADPAVKLGVLALRRREQEKTHVFERAIRVLSGVGAAVLSEQDAREWAEGELEAYASQSGAHPPQDPQAGLGLPDAA
jgi:hypothetical protein